MRGGTRLKQALQEILDKATKSSKVRVGFLEGATYPNGVSVATVAMIQEFGAPAVGIPPRPFFRSMVSDHSSEWGSQLGQILVDTGYDSTATLEMMGAGVSSQLRESIIDLTSPPLSPVTVMLRKMRRDNPNLVMTKAVVREARAKVAAGVSVGGTSTKPLIDTGLLLHAVDYEVD